MKPLQTICFKHTRKSCQFAAAADFFCVIFMFSFVRGMRTMILFTRDVSYTISLRMRILKRVYFIIYLWKYCSVEKLVLYLKKICAFCRNGKQLVAFQCLGFSTISNRLKWFNKLPINLRLCVLNKLIAVENNLQWRKDDAINKIQIFKRKREKKPSKTINVNHWLQSHWFVHLLNRVTISVEKLIAHKCLGNAQNNWIAFVAIVYIDHIVFFKWSAYSDIADKYNIQLFRAFLPLIQMFVYILFI